MSIRSIARTVQRRFDHHRPLVEVSVSKQNLLHNLNTYRAQYPDLQFAPVLKSNAYGHGLTVIAKLLDDQPIAFFMVDSFYEARVLRRDGIRSRIVVMGYVDPEEIVSDPLPATEYAIVDIEQLRVVAKIAKHPLKLHLKIDTGMHRHGILPAQLPEAIALISAHPDLEVHGVCSHFADADNADPAFTLSQLTVWNESVVLLEKEFPLLTYRHIAATKGVSMSERANANVARLGIGLYGFDTSPSGTTNLKPVMELRSVISSIREIPAGDGVGYNVTYTADAPTRIATVPVGYYEGLDRRLSNKGVVLVNGKACPIVGRVSMNMCGIDVTGVPDAKPGDRVVIISRNREDTNSVENITKLVSSAEYAETPYVILTHVPQHLKRVVE